MESRPITCTTYGISFDFIDKLAFSLLNSSQLSPNNSTGCCARSEPLPQHIESAGQYLSQPQQIRSGCAGCIGNFLAISLYHSDIKLLPGTL